MKKHILFVWFSFACFTLLAQVPPVRWEKTIGGADMEGGVRLLPLPDNSVLACSITRSDISGDISEDGQGGLDYWVAKLDSTGTMIWQNTIGGISNDTLRTAILTPDGGFLIAGSGGSNSSGDKTEDSKGLSDYWLVKLDSIGNIQWDKTIGGTDREGVRALIQTPDGGFLIGGNSLSGAGADKTQSSRGSFDCWLVKTDANGNKLWDKTLGGSLVDRLEGLALFDGGNILVAGNSNSNISGDKTENSKGGRDYWILKLNDSGDIIWQHTIGGNTDDICKGVTATPDGGFLLSGYSASNASGDKSQNSKGSTDYWIVKVDGNGEVLWDKTIGGNSDDNMFNHAVRMYDGGFALAGYSYSPASGDKTENNGGECDLWLVRTDSMGNIKWDNTLGCDNIEIVYSANVQLDGGIMVTGETNTIMAGCDDHEGPGNGMDDTWVVQYMSELCLDTLSIFSDTDGDGFGNAAEHMFWVACEEQPQGYVTDSTDCDDTDASIHPNAIEILNGKDDDCDEEIDEDDVTAEFTEPDFYFNIYPNPANEFFTLYVDLRHQELNYDIEDITGALVLYGEINSSTTIIRIDALPMGIYFIRIGDKRISFIKTGL